MSDPRMIIFGSVEDVAALKQVLTEANVPVQLANPVDCNKGGMVTGGIIVTLTPVILPHIARCFCVYVQRHSKKVVETNGKKTIFRGYSASEVQTMLKDFKQAEIKNDAKKQE
jgi:hypothetical protein